MPWRVATWELGWSSISNVDESTGGQCSLDYQLPSLLDKYHLFICCSVVDFWDLVTYQSPNHEFMTPEDGIVDCSILEL